MPKQRNGIARQKSQARYRRRSTDGRPLLGIEETGRYLGVSRWTIRRMIDSGALPFVRVNGRRKILPADLDEYLGLTDD